MFVDPMVAVIVTATIIKKFANSNFTCVVDVLTVEDGNLQRTYAIESPLCGVIPRKPLFLHLCYGNSPCSSYGWPRKGHGITQSKCYLSKDLLQQSIILYLQNIIQLTCCPLLKTQIIIHWLT